MWFWGALSMPYVSWGIAWYVEARLPKAHARLHHQPLIARYFDAGEPVGLLLATVAAIALAALWLRLPWDRRVSLRRKLMAPAFLAGVFVVGRIFPGSTIMFYPIAFANGVFLFGFKRGMAYAVAILAVIFVDAALCMWLIQTSPTWSIVTGNALLITALYAVGAVFVIGICKSILEAIRSREEVRSVLGKLEVAHADLEGAHAELQAYAKRVRELAVSEERTRMARDIHDTLGHYLTAINLQLEYARRSRHKNPEGAWKEVGESRALLSVALSEVRRAVRALKPLDLEERSGPGAMAALACSFEGVGPEVSFRIEGKEGGLSEQAELLLYRTMQEGLTNALKHSDARHVRASLSFTEEAVKLSISDDGAGAAEGATERGFGLAAIRDRADEQGGTLSAGNVAGGGFLLEVSIPDHRRRE